jgi:hypothetical protein
MARREQVAQQLRMLLDRHNLAPADIERLSEKNGAAPISAVTVRRILKGEARTEPEPTTLRRIAEAAGERYTTAFPETDTSTQIDVSHLAGRFHVRFLGASAPSGLESDLRKVLDRYEKKAEKEKGKRKSA